MDLYLLLYFMCGFVFLKKCFVNGKLMAALCWSTLPLNSCVCVLPYHYEAVKRENTVGMSLQCRVELQKSLLIMQ